jgi:hypothetical protein
MQYNAANETQPPTTMDDVTVHVLYEACLSLANHDVCDSTMTELNQAQSDVIFAYRAAYNYELLPAVASTIARAFCLCHRHNIAFDPKRYGCQHS